MTQASSLFCRISLFSLFLCSVEATLPLDGRAETACNQTSSQQFVSAFVPGSVGDMCVNDFVKIERICTPASERLITFRAYKEDFNAIGTFTTRRSGTGCVDVEI